MAKDYKQLWKGVVDATERAEAVRVLVEMVADFDGRTFALGLEPKEVKLCVETLDYGTTKHNLETHQKHTFSVALRRLAEHHELLPDRITIEEKVEVSDKVLSYGGSGGVRLGKYKGARVAVKTARVATRDNLQKIRKRFYREVALWSTLSHKNILKLVGVQVDVEKGQFATVSEWMAHGNVIDYIKSNEANRLELLHGAAQGLRYLHGVRLAHGDLKGENILMSNDTPPHACLAGFDSITTIPGPGQNMARSAQIEGGTMAFMSPELLVPQKFGKERAVPNPQADVYAFGLVIFQVLTGEAPFRGFRRSALAHRVLRGERPGKPVNASTIGFSDSLWDFTRRCWGDSIESRPEVGEVVKSLGEAAAGWDGLMPPCPQAGDFVSDPEEAGSDLEHSGIFEPPLNNASESPDDSEKTTGPLSTPSTLPTQPTELPQN